MDYNSIESLMIKIEERVRDHYPWIEVRLYYEGKAESFVVKIDDVKHPEGGTKFKNENLIDALLDAYEYVMKENCFFIS